MTWSEIFEHDALHDGFRRAVARGRLASTFLFVGPPGVGKRTFALKLAQALLCETNPEEQLEPCGTCASCVQVAAGTHPDLELIRKPDDKSFIPLELLIGDREHRNREGLCHRIALKPMRGGRKIAIIDDADHLNVEGANCLLKTLEEPPPRSVIFLIGTGEQRQLPTIRSRSQIVRFGPLSIAAVEQLLVQHQLVEDPSQARELAELSGGSVQQAVDLRDEELRAFRRQLIETFNSPHLDSVALAASIVRFVEAAGKEAPPRRQRLRQVVGWTLGYFRAALRDDARAEAAADCLDRSLAALRQIDANANVTTVIEAWIDDLARESVK